MAVFTERKRRNFRIDANGTVFVDTVIEVLRDGVKFGESMHTDTFVPAADISALDEETQAVCAAVWTPERVAAYQASQAE